jgi:Flagellin and related hook-associated proteins
MANVSIATNSSVYSGVISDEVPRLQRDISRLREQISSGKPINRPSDDPTSFATAERMKTLGNQLARREESIASARTFVDRTQQELDGLADLFTRAREDGVRAADDTRSADDRAAIANELRSIKGEVVDRMNSTQDGEYIFAGNRTDTQPFAADGSANDAAPINGSLDALDGDRTRPIGKNQDLTINIDGKALAQYDTRPAGTRRPSPAPSTT